jgi:hypothetical protein
MHAPSASMACSLVANAALFGLEVPFSIATVPMTTIANPQARTMIFLVLKGSNRVWCFKFFIRLHFTRFAMAILNWHGLMVKRYKHGIPVQRRCCCESRHDILKS